MTNVWQNENESEPNYLPICDGACAITEPDTLMRVASEDEPGTYSTITRGERFSDLRLEVAEEIAIALGNGHDPEDIEQITTSDPPDIINAVIACTQRVKEDRCDLFIINRGKNHFPTQWPGLLSISVALVSGKKQPHDS